MTDHLEQKLAEKLHQQYLVHRYGPLMLATGYSNLAVTPEETMLIGGRIMHDSQVSKLAREKYATRCSPDFCVYEYDYEAAVLSLSDDERDALRERIGWVRRTGVLGVPD